MYRRLILWLFFGTSIQFASIAQSFFVLACTVLENITPNLGYSLVMLVGVMDFSAIRVGVGLFDRFEKLIEEMCGIIRWEMAHIRIG